MRQKRFYSPVVRNDVDVVCVLDDTIVQLPEWFAAYNTSIVYEYIHLTYILDNLCGTLIDLLSIRYVHHIALAIAVAMFGQQINRSLDGCQKKKSSN